MSALDEVFELHFAQERAIQNAWRKLYNEPVIRQSAFIAEVLKRCPQASIEYVAEELARKVAASRFRSRRP